MAKNLISQGLKMSGIGNHILNTGNNASARSFFEMLHLFDLEGTEHSKGFTKEELNKLLLGPTRQGYLGTALQFACALQLIRFEKDSQKYYKENWLPCWDSRYTNEQLTVLIFIRLSSFLRELDLKSGTAIQAISKETGYDLIISLCWILLLRPQKFGFEKELNRNLNNKLEKHNGVTNKLKALEPLRANIPYKNFRSWLKILQLIDEKYAPMNIFSNSMIEYIQYISKKEPTSNIQILLEKHLYLFSNNNAIIHDLYNSIIQSQEHDDVTQINNWNVLSSVMWSLAQRDQAGKIELQQYHGDGLKNVSDGDFNNTDEFIFGRIDWSI